MGTAEPPRAASRRFRPRRAPRPRPGSAGPPPLTANVRAFRVMVRNAAFRRAELAAKRDWSSSASWTTTGMGRTALGGRFRGLLRRARQHRHRPCCPGRDLWQVTELGRTWRARQVLDDPAGYHEWAIVLDIDLDVSDQAGEPAVRPVGVERL